MKSRLLIILTAVILFLVPKTGFGQAAPNLGATSSFAVYTAAGAFNNGGATVITGDVASHNSLVVGFPPGTVNGTIYPVGHAIVNQAFTDVDLAYTDLFSRTPDDVILTPLENNISLGPGVHSIGSAAILSDNLILTGGPNDIFILKIGGALTVSAGKSIILAGGAQWCNVYWQVVSWVDIGAGSNFIGTIVAGGAISLGEAASLHGRALTKAGAIALSNNAISFMPAIGLVVGGTGSICTGTGTNITVALSEAGTSYQLRNDNANELVGVVVAGTGGSINLPTGNLTATTTFNVYATNGCGSVELTETEVVTVNTQAAPTLGSITQPTCTVATGSVDLTGLPAGNWTINPGGITGSTGSQTISGLTAGTYNYTVTNADGCISAASANVVVNAQPSTPVAPTIGAITQPTCALATGSVVLSGLPAGNWIVNPGAIAGNTATTNISGLAAGTYNYTVTNSAGCTSAESADVVISAQPATPAAPLVGIRTQPTCVLATGSVVLNGLPAGNWTINPGGITGSTGSKTISGLAAGTYNYTVTNAAGCTSLASLNVVINAQPATPAAPVTAITQPTCAVATGSVLLSSLPAGNWIVNPGSLAGNTLTTNISGLAAGTYNYTVTNSDGCTSAASTDVVINVPPATPAAPLVGLRTQPTCVLATGSVVLNGLPAGNWTINPGGITGSTVSKTISGLAAGTYNYTVTNAAGCTSAASANVVINPAPSTISVPNQTASILSGLTFTETPTGAPAATTYTWTAPSYTGGVLGGVAESVPQSIISGTLTIPSGSGTAVYTVTPIYGTCTGPTFIETVTVDATCVPVSIGVQPIDNNMCEISGIAILTLTAAGSGPFTYQWEYNNGGTWENAVNGSPAGAVYSNQNTKNLGVSGITISGIYQYRNYLTNCSGANNITSGTANLTVNTVPTAPIPAVTQPTCILATGSVELSGLPAGNWTIDPGAIAGSGLITTIAGLTDGTYNYTVTSAAGCTSAASIDVVINAPLVTPAAPVVGLIIQPTCAFATGSVVLSGLPAGNWTINPGGITGSTGSKTISGLAAGTYNYTVTNAAGCTSTATANVVINAQPATPAAPGVGAITQPTCLLSTGSVALSGLPAGNWIINPGALAGNTLTTNISGLAAGTYNYTVTNSDGCTSAESADVVISAQPATPAAPLVGIRTQPTCVLATGSVVLNGLPAGNWTINPGGITGNTGSKTISGLAAGTYNYTVTNAAGCTSAATANIVINAQPATPAAPGVGAITQPTCLLSTGSVALNGLPAGNWEIMPGALAGNTATTNISGLSAGTYNYTVTNADGCTSAESANVVISAQPSTPAAPLVGLRTQPSCVLATGSVVLNGLPAGNWTINPGGITGSTGSKTISGLAAGTYNYTVTNAAGCTSLASLNVVINAQPATPAAPVTAITQPTCAVATGSVLLSGLPAGNWTVNPGALAGNTLTTNISGLASGTYNYTVTNSDGCTSAASTDVVINVQPVTPAAPLVGLRTQPTCVLATGSVVLNSLPAGNWTINPGGITGSTVSKTISGLAAGTYNYTVTNAAGCTSAASANVVINAQPATPAAPTSTLTQPTCVLATGTITITAPTEAGMTYSIDGLIYANSSGLFAGLSAGTYSLTAKNSAGCVSSASAVTLIAPTLVQGCVSPGTVVTILAQPAMPVAVPGSNSPVLPASSINLTSVAVTGATYAWTGPNGFTSALQNPVIPSATAANAGVYTLTVSTITCTSLPVNTSVVVDNNNTDLSIINTVDNTYPLIGRKIILTVVASNNGPASATGVIVTDLLEGGYTYDTSTASTGTYNPATGIWTIGNLANGATATITITATVKPAGSYSSTGTITGNEPDPDISNNTSTTITDPTDFFIPEGFSPNGDGINDLFIIRGIFYFPDNSIVIFNRWGNKVYEADPYINTWDGRSIRGLRVGGDELPTGTYFYVIDPGDGSAIIKGTIYLNR